MAMAKIGMEEERERDWNTSTRNGHGSRGCHAAAVEVGGQERTLSWLATKHNDLTKETSVILHGCRFRLICLSLIETETDRWTYCLLGQESEGLSMD